MSATVVTICVHRDPATLPCLPRFALGFGPDSRIPLNIKLIAPEVAQNSSLPSSATFKIQRPNLPLLAALTPAGHNVRVVDEAFAPDCVEDDLDLVGITVMTELASRAYSIAGEYRKRGVRVVLGGIHPTVRPEEALAHADAIVVGEAEQTWPQLVTDAAAGRLRRSYRATGPTDVTRLPVPDRALYPSSQTKGYTPFAVGLESARGCPYDCEFCSVSSIWGRGLRSRPARDVLKEIESIALPNLFFVDDTLALNKAQARELFTGLRGAKRNWVGQGGVSLAEDSALLRLMKQAGCCGLLIGFESVQAEAQAQLPKVRHRRIDYIEAMRRFHGEGIMVLGAFVFGFDHENCQVFDQTLEFSLRCRLDGAQFRILCPFPGTRLYKRLLEEGRLIAPEWWLNNYSSDTLLFRPKRMAPQEFLDGLEKLIREFYSLGAIAGRFFGVRPWKRSLFDSAVYAGLNLASRKRYNGSLGSPQPLLAGG